MTYRPSEGKVELQGGRVSEGEGVWAEGVTRYVPEATGADGGDIRLILFETEPKERRAGCHTWWESTSSYPSSSAATSTVHQGASVVCQREDLHFEVSTRGYRLWKQMERFLVLHTLTICLHISTY